MTARADYNIHGVTVAVEVADTLGRPALSAVDRRLRPFRAELGAPAPAVRLELVDHPLTPPTSGGRAVYDSTAGPVQYHDEEATLFAQLGRGAQLLCRPSAGLARLACRPTSPDSLWLATHPLLTLALIELLKYHSRYSLHAACVAADGRGILIAGPSGAGKTTLAVGLARSGLAFVADDMVFLDARAGRVEVLGFADEVDVTENTLSMFEELRPAAARQEAGGRKWSLRLEDALDFAPVYRCPPALLVLARVSERESSQIAPVAASEALVELAPNVLLTDPASAQAHLAALAQLAATTPCVRLDTGRDFDRLPGLLTGTSVAPVS